MNERIAQWKATSGYESPPEEKTDVDAMEEEEEEVPKPTKAAAAASKPPTPKAAAKPPAVPASAPSSRASSPSVTPRGSITSFFGSSPSPSTSKRKEASSSGASSPLPFVNRHASSIDSTSSPASPSAPAEQPRKKSRAENLQLLSDHVDDQIASIAVSCAASPSYLPATSSPPLTPHIMFPATMASLASLSQQLGMAPSAAAAAARAPSSSFTFSPVREASPERMEIDLDAIPPNPPVMSTPCFRQFRGLRALNEHVNSGRCHACNQLDK